MIADDFVDWATNNGYHELPISPLVRSDENLFTFTPFLDLAELYMQTDSASNGFKVQPCFRNVYPQNMHNPISTPFQELFSLHSFAMHSDLGLLTDFISSFLVKIAKLAETQLYWVIPDVPAIEALFIQQPSLREHAIVIPEQRLRCMLPLPGDHYYIKIVYLYHGGLVTVANFVLVNLEDGHFKLDSVIYPARLTMIQDDGKFLYDTASLQPLKEDFAAKIDGNANIFNFVIGQMHAITNLSNYITVGNKKQAYTLKRLERELFDECRHHNIDLEACLTVLAQSPLFNPTVIAQLQQNGQRYAKNRRSAIKAAAKKIVHLAEVDAATLAELHGTYGLDFADIRDVCQSHNVLFTAPEVPVPARYGFQYDEAKNNYTDPVREYK